MSPLQDSEITWIPIKDLNKPKMCPLCHQPMCVKQLNLAEACRTCFNTECPGIADIEYIQRSYRDMQRDIEEADDFSKLTFKEELQEIHELWFEVESLVSHRLSKEVKNNLKSLKKKNEDMKNKPQDCDQYNNSSDLTKTQDIPLIHLKPSTTNSCAFSQVNSEENVVHQYQSNQYGIEQRSAVAAIVYPLSFDGKVYPSAFDTASNNIQQSDREAKADYYISSSDSACLDLKAHQQVICCKAPTSWFNSTVDCKDILPKSNDGFLQLNECLINELGEEKLSQSKPIKFEVHLDDQGEVALSSKETRTVQYRRKSPVCSEPAEDRTMLSLEQSPSTGKSSFVSKPVNSTKFQTNICTLGNSKLALGFRELKNFQGLKSSVGAPETKSKVAKSIVKAKKNVCVEQDVATKAIDDIEKAIASAQQSGETQSSHWLTMFSDLL